MNVLAINSGSSFLKFKVVEFGGSAGAAASRDPSIHYEGSAEGIGPATKLMLRRGGKMVVQATDTVSTHAEAVQRLMQMLEQSSKLEGRDFSIGTAGEG
ncbi:MAG: hypothetical protein OEY77_06145 [Nitrospira sp.]|nr:hypothetical protein [Nitrospira sp.]